MYARGRDLRMALSEQKKESSESKPLVLLRFKAFSLNTSNANLSSSSLLQEFSDVLAKEMPPGLPPIRGIEHQIDFAPGSTIPNRPAYRSNPEETKELQR